MLNRIKNLIPKRTSEKDTTLNLKKLTNNIVNHEYFSFLSIEKQIASEMAYAALVTLSQLLDHTLNHPHKYFYIPCGDDRRKMESLQESSAFLQAFLDHHRSSKGGEDLQPLLEIKIRDAAYRAQDIIEWHISSHVEFIHEDGGVETLQLGTQNTFYESDLDESLDFFHLIVEETCCSDVEESQISTAQPPSLASSSREGKVVNEMVGYAEDLIAIQERLCGESTKLKIIPIVGMGGIGKTTLARTLFDDSLIAYHFHTRAWATISQVHRLQGILRAILHSLTLKTKELEGEVQRSNLPETSDESLIESVYHSLIGKRYLIVLDDMWSTEAWDDLRMIFPDNNNGSRIIVTTRLRNVAEYASSFSPIHQMHLLNEDESWNLLRERVFVEESCPPELEEIGKIITEYCGGLPLAVVVAAGILTKVEMAEYQWKNVADNLSAAVETSDRNFSKVLSLSYNHLPLHLKTCFLYVGTFSEEKEISVSNLIMLWVAEGFLKPIQSKTFESVAEEYLEELVERNLISMTTKTWTGRYKSCGVHDLLRDLCIQKAEDEEFLSVIDKKFGSRGINLTNSRRLAIHNSMEVNVSKDLLVRSIMQYNVLWELQPLLSCSRLVRVLVMPKAWLRTLPNEITELCHLRYLAAFVYSNMGAEPLVLPSTISNLQNLQTLIVERLANEHSTSPVLLDVWKMPLLRHVILKGCMLQIPPPPTNCLVLENLQTVSKLTDFKLTKKATSMIPNVKELKLVYTSWPILGLEDAVQFQQLETLKLNLLHTGLVEVNDATDALKISVPFPVHYGLPNTIKTLSLVGCRPPSEDMSIIGSLPSLEVLKLKIFDFVDRCWETKEGEYKRLKFLRIYWSNIKSWRTESSHFPRLEHLIVRGCWVLEEVPCEIGEIGTLKVIEVDKCSQSAADSALLIQEEQESMGNEVLVVKVLSKFP